MDGLLGRAALPVDGGAGHVLGQVGGQPAGAGDVAGLPADGVDAAVDHVLDRAGVDAGAGHQRAQRVGAEVGGVDLAQPAAASPHGGADRIDDEGFSHGQISSGSGDALAVPGRIAVGAGEGPGALEVAVQVVLDGVADGAVALQRLAAAEAGGVGRHGLGHRDVARLHRGGGAAHRRAGEGELLERVGEVVLHRLERADRHAELLALLARSRRSGRACAGRARRAGRRRRGRAGRGRRPSVASRIGCSRAT